MLINTIHIVAVLDTLNKTYHILNTAVCMCLVHYLTPVYISPAVLEKELVFNQIHKLF